MQKQVAISSRKGGLMSKDRGGKKEVKKPKKDKAKKSKEKSE